MFEYRHLLFKRPFTMMVAGPSGSGKTWLVRRILQSHKILLDYSDTLLNVLWAYGQWQSNYGEPIENTNIDYVDGLPSEQEIISKNPDIIVIDDLMNELGDNSKLGNLFTKVSHHKNISVIFITQNLYHKGKQMRNISLSCHYLIIMKNPRDRSQIDILGRQMKLTNELSEAYSDATASAHSYLLIDLKQDTPASLIFRTRITPDEHIKGIFSPIIYSPR